MLSNSFVTISGTFGTFEIGMDTNVLANNLIENPNPSILIGNSPLLGVWAPGVAGTNFNNDTAFFDQGSAYGIHYTSPSFDGIQVAVDFMPPAGAGGTGGDGGIEQTNAANGYNGISAGLGNEYDAVVTYHNKFGGADIGLEAGIGDLQRSVTTVGGLTPEGTHFTQIGYQAGASVTIAGFQIAGAIVDRTSPSGLGNVEKIDAQDGVGGDIGIQYTAGPWLIAASYYLSQGPNIATAGSGTDSGAWYDITGGYTLGPGVTLTLTGFEYETELDNAVSLKATDTGIVFGTLVNF
jgi:predicted porin